MSIFTQEVKKTWTLKIQGTGQAKERYDAVQDKLKEIDPTMKFELESQLENQIEALIVKAEKELKQLIKQPESTPVL
jgi:hypothetical protein